MDRSQKYYMASAGHTLRPLHREVELPQAHLDIILVVACVKQAERMSDLMHFIPFHHFILGNEAHTKETTN